MIFHVPFLFGFLVVGGTVASGSVGVGLVVWSSWKFIISEKKNSVERLESDKVRIFTAKIKFQTLYANTCTAKKF